MQKTSQGHPNEQSNGQRKPKWKIDMDGKPFTVDDPILTGRQLLQLASRHPIEEHLVYLIASDKRMEDLALEETVDLRARGIEKFITFKGDRSFRFELNGNRQDWGAPAVTEAVLRGLSGATEDQGIWLEARDQPDRPIGRDDIIELTNDGVERFYLGDKVLTVIIHEPSRPEPKTFRWPITLNVGAAADEAASTFELPANEPTLQRQDNTVLDRAKTLGEERVVDGQVLDLVSFGGGV